ncbi:unnamed protein product, partial [Ectocarpus sp. 4 AP-2014]
DAILRHTCVPEGAQGRTKLLQAGTRRASLQPRSWVYMRRASTWPPHAGGPGRVLRGSSLPQGGYRALNGS